MKKKVVTVYDFDDYLAAGIAFKIADFVLDGAEFDTISLEFHGEGNGYVKVDFNPGTQGAISSKRRIKFDRKINFDVPDTTDNVRITATGGRRFRKLYLKGVAIFAVVTKPKMYANLPTDTMSIIPDNVKRNNTF
jgi:hypothetical protein